MMDKDDIGDIGHIRLLVDSFYGNARANDLLGPIFNTVIQDRWPQHLEKMYRFWQTVLLEEHTYNGSPFPPHAQLPIAKAHFDSWLKCWQDTVDTHFYGPKADEAKWRGGKMAAMFFSKMEYYKNRHTGSLI